MSKLDRDEGIEQIKDPVILFGILINSLRSIEERLSEIMESLDTHNRILIDAHELESDDYDV
jgi:hypothetical protein